MITKFLNVLIQPAIEIILFVLGRLAFISYTDIEREK